MSEGKARIRKRAAEARELVSELTTPAASLSAKELAFVLSIEAKLRRGDAAFVSGRQMAWLRGLAARRSGLNRLAEQVSA